ncbi:hypothetical protein Dimus_017222 [Dionaea muscipula]
MAHVLFILALGFALFTSSCLVSAKVVHHTFTVQNTTVQKLCQERVITTVNGVSPGPLLKVHEGDRVIVNVVNESPYNVTIHWHGIFQRQSQWADGVEYTTQCPIQPGNSYVQSFNVTGQEGTLWWHAHIGWLRATLYGGIIIYPRKGRSDYPFPTPHKEYPIILGEWWNANVVDVLSEALATGGPPNISDAFLVNGQPGDLFPCSSNDTYKISVKSGKTYLLRIINAALINQLFFKIANHNFTVVAIDASYTEPYDTDVVLVAPGQTTDILLTANQSIGSYYMAARPYISNPAVIFDNTTTTAILEYEGSNSSTSSTLTPGISTGVESDDHNNTLRPSYILQYKGSDSATSSNSTPVMPTLPAYNDTDTATNFNTNLTALVNGRFCRDVPLTVDEDMLMTTGLGLVACRPNATCAGPLGQALAASISGFSFQFPTKLSMLEAHFNNVSGIYNATFPDQPRLSFDYTNTIDSFDPSLVFTTKSTTVKQVKFNTTLQIVFQGTSLVGTENHPMHLHGVNFHVMAQGFGNYDNSTDPSKFNLVNPLLRNTIGVPVGGWVAIRFRANNPGVWLLHCHLDNHLPIGLVSAFVIDNGGTPSTTLPPPPSDLPKC